jgi:hypothetical protein
MANGTSPNALWSSETFKTYASASAVDFTASTEINGYCRSIYSPSAGTLVVTRLDDTSVTITFAAGSTVNVVAKAMVSGSATNFLVMG